MSNFKQLKSVQTQLLRSYLGVMIATLGVSFLVVERWVSYDLNQQFNDYLFQLAEAASQTLEIVKHESREHEEGDYNKDELPEEHYRSYYPKTYPKNERQQGEDDKDESPEQHYQSNSKTSGKLADLMAGYDRHGTLAIPKHHPLYYAQGIEWFDEEQELIIREGDLNVNWSLSKHLEHSSKILEKNKIRSLALPVFYTPPRSETEILSGYIRVSHVTEVLDVQLERLRWGLIFGSMVAVGLTAWGGIWLTNKSLEPIGESFQRLKQFTGDASHELRSPLTVIQSSISVLQSHPERIDPVDKNKVDAIADASHRMTQLVEDLLLLARLDGSVALIGVEKIPLPLDEILEDTIEFAHTAAEQKEIELNSSLDSNIWVLGDGQQLQRVFSNLIENAVQYTPTDGKVTVSLFTDTDNQTAIITVEDTGIGIAPEDLPHIFERLWRSERAKIERREGTGLGMAIAQTLVQVHGGKIDVTSKVGLGSCFWVKLPILKSRGFING
ncbi:MAG: HAMP domain-containing histidine kinase [Okeania sp. SIO3I5]|uniref:sensor histidine kinase n=1 Tax=Okeania sp. SIO3I5 TaxID=2607805 RepID=UPI0013BE3B90|nr:HAMP domain-containing sensor histidine kinase [Okeania sp. SIO3I5]NEQ36860.1 HAMP domain-containing histidine kinase [Okeania sp. SIO3I5]